MEHIQLNFQPTSCYDHTLHEAFSRVVQKLIESLPYIEDLLNVFCAVRFLSSRSGIWRVMLTYVRAFRTRRRPRRSSSTSSRVCMSQRTRHPSTRARTVCAATMLKRSLPSAPYTREPTVVSFSTVRSYRAASSAAATPARLAQPTLPSTISSTAFSTTTGSASTANTTSSRSRSPAASPAEPKAPFSLSAALSLAQGTTLTFHQATPALALLALLPTGVYEARRGLLEYNVVFLREGVQEIVNVEREARGGAT
jgi:Ras-related GTP-binding protein C/D